MCILFGCSCLGFDTSIDGMAYGIRSDGFDSMSVLGAGLCTLGSITICCAHDMYMFAVLEALFQA